MYSWPGFINALSDALCFVCLLNLNSIHVQLHAVVINNSSFIFTIRYTCSMFSSFGFISLILFLFLTVCDSINNSQPLKIQRILAIQDSSEQNKQNKIWFVGTAKVCIHTPNGFTETKKPVSHTIILQWLLRPNVAFIIYVCLNVLLNGITSSFPSFTRIK